MSTDNRLTIEMSETRPISIIEDNWPLLAEANRYRGTTLLEVIRVRKHEDGRVLVYGWHKAHRDPAGCYVEGKYAGWLLPTDASEPELLRTIRRVGGVLNRMSLADQAIAALPANEVALPPNDAPTLET